MSCETVLEKMEGDKGLELSLGLSCGSATEESKPVSRSEDEFKNFCSVGKQRQESEKFSSDKADKAHASTGEGIWIGNKLGATEEGKQPDTGAKRKSLFDELDHHKKHLAEPQCTSLGEKAKASLISIRVEDSSNLNSEDVGESDADGSMSKPISCDDDDRSKQFTGINGSLESSKQLWPSIDCKATVPEQKRLTISSESEVMPRNQANGNPFSVQSVNVIPYWLSTEVATTAGMPRSSSQPLLGIAQKMMSSATNEKFASQAVNPGNFHATLGYSSVPLPMLNKDNSWGMVSHRSQFYPSHISDGAPISGSVQPIVHHARSSTSEEAKADGNKHVAEKSSPMPAEEMKGNSINCRENFGSSDPQITDSLPLDFSSIRPGIAADLKFGGSGSYPNLPWVSTTGYGPHGQTISGVTYRLSTNQIRIVCACHGSHLSPEEFVRHANEEYIPDDIGPAFAGTNPAASTRS